MNSTLKDIAELAGVSMATASRALTGNGSVSKEKKALVLEAAKRLGFPLPDGRRPTGHLAFILKRLDDQEPMIENPYFSRVLKGAEDETARLGYNLIYMTLDEGALSSGELPPALLRRQVDGLLVMGTFNPESMDALTATGLPLVVVSGYPEGGGFPRIVVDNAYGAREITRYMISEYGPDVACFTYARAVGSLRERVSGFRHAFADMGLDPSTAKVHVAESDGVELASRVFAAGLQPRGIFCVMDKLAVEVLKWAGASGVRVPTGLAVAGFDDIEVASQVYPALTTMHIHKEDMGSLGVHTLSRLLGGSPVPPVTLLGTSLVVRDSA